MGKYEVYPEYKDSGVSWLGEIPSKWIQTELKRYATVQGGFAFSSDSFIDAGKPVIRIGDIKQDGSVSLDSCKYISDESLSSYEQYEVHCGDLLMAMTGATIGKAGWYQEKESALLNQRVGSFKSSQDYLNYKFFWYVLNSAGYQEYIKLTAFGGAQPNISDAGMVGYKSALPTISEQQKIANFLDHETAKIDTLIEKQQQLIALLKEKRQAVISHAVTKGLNPNVPMRDSGVEWLGEVPQHWNTGRLTYQVDLLVDGTHHSPESYPEGDYLYITAKNIKEHGFDFSNISYISSPDHEEIYSRCSVVKNDVLYIKDGATAGVAMVNNLEEQFSLLSSVALIRPRKDKLRPNYLKHHLNAAVFKNEMLNRLSGGAMTRFTIDGISRFNVLIPPLEEQDHIVELIDAKVGRMNVVIEKAEKAIGFMLERRTALISAAVTGKIDVRHWNAQ